MTAPIKKNDVGSLVDWLTGKGMPKKFVGALEEAIAADGKLPDGAVRCGPAVKEFCDHLADNSNLTDGVWAVPTLQAMELLDDGMKLYYGGGVRGVH